MIVEQISGNSPSCVKESSDVILSFHSPIGILKFRALLNGSQTGGVSTGGVHVPLKCVSSPSPCVRTLLLHSNLG